MAETLPASIRVLELVLRREWGLQDHARMMGRLTRVAAGADSLDEAVNEELAHLRAAEGHLEAAEQIGDRLRVFYARMLQSWSVITERHPTSSPAPAQPIEEDYSDDDDDLSEASDDADADTDVLSHFKIQRCEDTVGEDDADEEICSVCLERLHQGIVATLDCRHEFHGDCIRRWLVYGQNFCPLCKARAIRWIDSDSEN